MSSIYAWIESEPVATAVNVADSLLLYQSTTGAMAQVPVSTARKMTVTACTSAATINPGVATLSTLALATTLTAPTAGARVWLTTQVAVAARTINAGTGATYDGTNNVLTATGIQSVELIGLSSTRWQIISNLAATSLTTSIMGLTTA